MKRGAVRILGLLVLSVALAACSGDDDGDEGEGGNGGGGASPTAATTESSGGGGATSTPTTAGTETGGGASTRTPAAASTTSAGGGGGGGCSGTNLVLTHPGSDGSVELTSTAAVSIENETAYIGAAGDFEMDPMELSGSSYPVIPSGGSLAMVAIAIINSTQGLPTEPLEAGTTLEFTKDPDVLTFAVLSVSETTIFGNDTEGSGTLTLTSVGNTLCFEIDYSDVEKELTGTFEAAARAQ